jgi:hypothetical protein
VKVYGEFCNAIFKEVTPKQQLYGLEQIWPSRLTFTSYYEIFLRGWLIKNSRSSKDILQTLAKTSAILLAL